MADHLAVLNMPINALKRSHTVTSFEPFTLLSALAGATERIGLIATGSTTFDAPYHVARRFASLDHISGGRAGWNIVTTSNPDAALNFGLDDHMEHAERYKRAREFFDVVTGLWDSFADDAFRARRRARAVFRSGENACARPQGQISEGARAAEHRPPRAGLARDRAGRRLRRRAGSSRPRPPKPCSPAAVPCPTAKNSMPTSRAASRRSAATPSTCKILPGALVVVGDSVEEAKEKRAKLDSLVHYDCAHRLALGRARHRRLRLRS